MISRFIHQEIMAGRGINGEDYVHLDLTHLPPELIDEKLPDVTDFARTYLDVEPKTEGVPVQPTAHYAMGGLPTNIDGQVIQDRDATPVPGLYSAGESACVSVHGANRLGTNSLVDLVVFGRRAGKHMLASLEHAEWAPLPPEPEYVAQASIDRLLSAPKSGKGERISDIRSTMQKVMMADVSVERSETSLLRAEETIRQLQGAYTYASVMDKSKVFNTDLTEALELGCLLDCAEATIHGALARQESRGAHYRSDFTTRDDKNWLAHSLVYKTSGGLELAKKPVTITEFEPKERKY